MSICCRQRAHLRKQMLTARFLQRKTQEYQAIKAEIQALTKDAKLLPLRVPGQGREPKL